MQSRETGITDHILPIGRPVYICINPIFFYWCLLIQEYPNLILVGLNECAVWLKFNEKCRVPPFVSIKSERSQKEQCPRIEMVFR